MEGVLEGDDFVSLFTEVIVGIFTGQLDSRLARLRAAIAEEAAIGERHLSQHVGQFDLGLNVVQVGHMQKGAGLMANGLHNFGVTMAQVVHPQPGEKVIVYLTIGVPDPHPLAADQGNGGAPVGGGDMGVAAIDQGLITHLKGTVLHSDSLLTRRNTVNDGDRTGLWQGSGTAAILATVSYT